MLLQNCLQAMALQTMDGQQKVQLMLYWEEFKCKKVIMLLQKLLCCRCMANIQLSDNFLWNFDGDIKDDSGATHYSWS